MTQVGRDLKDYPVPTPLPWAGMPPTRPRCPGPWSNLVLNTSRDGASTISLGHLFQCLTTLWVKNFLLTSSLNLPSQFNNIPPCPVIVCLSKKSLSIYFISLLYVLKSCSEVSLEHCLQAEPSQLSQLFVVGEVQDYMMFVLVRWTLYIRVSLCCLGVWLQLVCSASGRVGSVTEILL